MRIQKKYINNVYVLTYTLSDLEKKVYFCEYVFLEG